MVDQVSRLSLEVDSTKVRGASDALNEFSGSGKRAEVAAEHLERSTKGAAQAMASASKVTSQAATAQTAYALATANAEKSEARLAKALLQSKTAQEALNKARNSPVQINESVIAEREVAARIATTSLAQATIAAAAAKEKAAVASTRYQAALAGTQTQAKLTAQQTAQLSFQLNDFFVQVASGGNPMLALVQQGSQLNGTFGGMRGALSALATVFTPVRLAMGGLATVAAALVGAFIAGDNESKALQRSLALTGNAAGITEGQFNDLARSIADATKTSIGSTRETLEGLISTGRFSGAALSQAATAAQLMAKVTGQSADEILKDFTRAGDGVAKFAEEANRSYNFLTAAQLAYVKQLEEQGEKQQALEIVFRALNGRLEEGAQKVSALSRAWSALKVEVSEAADALKSIGRDATPEDRLREINRQLGELQRAGQRAPLLFGASAAQLEQEKAALEETARLQRRAAQASAERAGVEQARVQVGKLQEQSLSKQEQLTRALAQANRLADQAQLSGGDRAKLLAGVRDRFADRGALAAAAAERRALLAADITAIRESMSSQVAAYQNGEGLLEALRQAGITGEREYYESKREFLAVNEAAQVQALEAENSRLRRQTAVGKERIELDREIGRNEAEIGRIRAEVAAKGLILNVQETSAIKARAAALREARIEAELEFERSSRALTRRVAAAGLGDEEARRIEELAEIEERYGRQRERLDAQLQLERDERRRAEYEASLLLLDQRQAAEIARANQHADAMLAANSKWENGASKALANYLSEVGNVAKQTEQLMTGALTRIEDVFVSFIMKGKADWKGFADFVVAELLRIIVRQQIASAVRGAQGGGWGAFATSLIGAVIGGSGGGSGASNVNAPLERAAGGPVSRGGLYRINESGRGPGEVLTVGNKQYLMANASGQVSNRSGGGGGMSVTNNFTVSGPIDRRSQQQIAAAAGRGVAVAVSRNE